MILRLIRKEEEEDKERILVSNRERGGLRTVDGKEHG
jgi:hypothetical protein